MKNLNFGKKSWQQEKQYKHLLRPETLLFFQIINCMEALLCLKVGQAHSNLTGQMQARGEEICQGCLAAVFSYQAPTATFAGTKFLLCRCSLPYQASSWCSLEVC